MAKAIILKELINELGLSLHSFEMSIGASNGSIRKVIESDGAISTALVEKIISKYPNVNQGWLLTGAGEMFIPAKRNLPEAEEYFDLPRAPTKKELEEMLGKGEKQETHDVEHEEVTDEDMELLRRFKQVEKKLGQRGINLMVLRHDDDLKMIKSHLKLK